MANRILFLDDEEAVRITLSRAAKGFGYETETAATLKEARAVLSTRPPDIAVLDLMLQEGKGIELVKDIIAADRNTVILFLTGNPDDESFRKEVSASAIYSILEKPVTLERLETMLKWAMEKRETALKPSRHELLAAVPEESEIKEMIVRAPRWKKVGYFAGILFFILLLAGILNYLNQPEETRSDLFGLATFMEKIEGYLKRAETREIELRNRAGDSGQGGKNRSPKSN